MAIRPAGPRGGAPDRRPAALPAPQAPLDTRLQDADWHGGKPQRTGRAKAVALEHRPERGDPRPRITATGSGAVAEQILQLAFANGVKVREDADLVEILALFEEDSLIPLEALAAVAEILAYVYRAENRPAPDFTDGDAAAGTAPAGAGAAGEGPERQR